MNDELLPSPAAATVTDESRSWRWALVGTLFLTLLTVCLAFCHRYSSIGAVYRLYADWVFWLPITQGLGMIALLFLYGLPKTWGGWSWLIFLNAWLIGVATANQFRAIEFLFAVVADLLLRVALLGLWTVALAGLPRTVFWVWRHRRPPRPAFRFGRWWFATLVLLITAEPLMAILVRDADTLQFPEPLPDPPTDELRIASIGDSTMFGHPYEPKFGIPQVLAWRVRQMYPQRRVVSENVAVPGQNLRQAIESLRHLQYRPHLLVLYSGHNEYYHDGEELAGTNASYFSALDSVLCWSPTFRVLNIRLRQTRILQDLKSGYLREFADLPIAGPEMQERRRLRFHHQLEQLARYGRLQGITMLWYVPAASESGYEPNRSCVRPGTSPREIDTLHEIAGRAADRQRAADWEAAAELYRAGLRLQPKFADFRFRLGECLLTLARPDEARRHFQEALDDDGHPVRATHAYRTAVTEVGAANSVPVVLTGEALRPSTAFGVLDRSLFHDNVHPTLRGFYYIGLAGAQRLALSRALEPHCGPAADVPPAEFAEAIKEMGINRDDVALALRRSANGLRWLGRLCFDPQRRVRQADEYIRLAERLEAGEIEPGDQGTEGLQ